MKKTFKHLRPAPLRLEELEPRLAPTGSLGTEQSFDTMTPGSSLPAGWSQWSSTGFNAFAVSSAESLSSPNSLAVSSPKTSGMGARAWLNTAQPANEEVSASIYLNSLIPIEVLARGSHLNTTTPSYYAVSVARGLDLKLLKVTNGTVTTIGEVHSAKWFANQWVNVTLFVSDYKVQAQLQNTKTGQYLNNSGQWQSSQSLALNVTDTSITSSGEVGVGRLPSYTGTVYVDNFFYAPLQPKGFSPAQISQAYGFNQITFGNGTIRGDGSGQTIAIVDAYNEPNLASDLQMFDAMYGIAPPPSLQIVNQSGGSTLPAANAVWGTEESADVEWAHAMAPGAKIILVEANTSGWYDLASAIDYARNLPGVSVVSISWTWEDNQGHGEYLGEDGADGFFTTPTGHTGVTFVAASGDQGSGAYEPSYPSTSPNVLAVGGTVLSTDTAGNYKSEVGWSGSGGGISVYESQPAYQKGVVTQSSSMRTVPDVSLNALGFAFYDSFNEGGWLDWEGTSFSTPIWAALVAIADQGRALTGKGTLDGPSQTLPAIYQMPSSNFHDVTTGSNGAYSAGPGYDLVTGRGSPLANLVVNSLISYG